MTETTKHENNRISLQHYIEALMREYKDAHTREHILLAENIENTKEALEIRLEGMNQFRAQILAERSALLTQDKFDAQHSALITLTNGLIHAVEKRVGTLEAAVANMRGRMTAIAASITIGLVIIQIGLHFLIK